MSLMGHKDLKTTMRYIRAVQLQRDVRSQNFGHKSPTQEIRPPVLAAVSFCYEWSGREDLNLRPLGPKPMVRQKRKFLPFLRLQPPQIS